MKVRPTTESRSKSEIVCEGERNGGRKRKRERESDMRQKDAQ